MVAKRGIMWDFQAQLDASFKRTFAEANKEVDALQKKMRFTVGAAPRSGGAGGTGGAGGAGGGAGKRDPREVAAERAMRLEAKWNRQTEAAIAKREAAEARAAQRAERDATRAADAKIREAKRAEREQAAIDRRAAADTKRADQAKARDFSTAAKRQKADALREQKADKDFWRDFERFGAERTKEKAKAEKDAAKERHAADREAELAARRQLETQNQVREGIYGTVHAFGQLTRAAAQFGVVGQRDMMRVLDTIFAVEGSINAVQGAMGAVRAIRGIRGARAAAGAAGVARVAGGVAGAGGIGGAGGTGLGAAAASAGIPAALLAIGALGLGATADMRRSGKGIAGLGHVGGAYDTIGSAGSGIAESGAGLLLRINAGLHAALNQPYGLTKQEGARWKERFLEKQIGLDYIPGARAALSSMKTERLQAELDFKRARQMEMNRSNVVGFEQQFGHAETSLEFQRMARERNLMLRENRSPLTREGPLFADLRGRSSAIGQQVAGLQDLQGRLSQERAERLQPGGMERGGEYDVTTAAKILEYEKQIRDLMAQQQQINRDIQRTGIDGLRQQLELRKQMAEGARNRFESALGSRQGLQERLGRMTPGRVAAISRSKEKAERGEHLSLFDIENLEQGDERSRFLAGEASRKRFRAMPESVRGTLGDVEEHKFQATQGSMGAASEGRDRLNQDIIDQERAAGIGRPPPVMVDAKYTNEIKVQLNAAAGDRKEFETQLSNEIMPKIEAAFQENVDRFADMIMEQVNARMQDMIRKQNQGARAAAGN